MTAAELHPTHPVHPVAAVVAQVRGELGSVSGTPVWSMSASEAGDALVAVTRLEAQLAQLKMRLLAHGERVEVGSDVGATSAAKLARAPDQDHPLGRAPERAVGQAAR